MEESSLLEQLTAKRLYNKILRAVKKGKITKDNFLTQEETKISGLKSQPTAVSDAPVAGPLAHSSSADTILSEPAQMSHEHDANWVYSALQEAMEDYSDPRSSSDNSSFDTLNIPNTSKMYKYSGEMNQPSTSYARAAKNPYKKRGKQTKAPVRKFTNEESEPKSSPTMQVVNSRQQYKPARKQQQPQQPHHQQQQQQRPAVPSETTFRGEIRQNYLEAEEEWRKPKPSMRPQGKFKSKNQLKKERAQAPVEIEENPELQKLDQYSKVSMVDMQNINNLMDFEKKIKWVKKTPAGTLMSTIHYGGIMIVKRQADRASRLCPEIPLDELNKVYSIGNEREKYESVYWTTTKNLSEIPKWTRIPHSAASISAATNFCPQSPTRNPDRFHSSDDITVIPMDDQYRIREIQFMTSRSKGVWFLTIREEVQYPNDTTDSGSINVEWGMVESLYDMLTEALKAPLPAARDVVNVPSGTYFTRRLDDTQNDTVYFVDITHDSEGEGFLRFVRIFQEEPSLSCKVTGEVAIPWHKFQFFMQHFYTMKNHVQ